jgi:hypothetical protein
MKEEAMHGAAVVERKPFVDLTLTEEASLVDVTLVSGGLGHGGDWHHGHGYGHGHGHGHDDSPTSHGHGGSY